MTKPTALYDIFVDDELVYVGMTISPKTRLTNHRNRGVVPHRARLEVVRWFDDRDEAAAAERARIQEFAPKRNRMRYVKPIKEDPMIAWEKVRAANAAKMDAANEAILAFVRESRAAGKTWEWISDRTLGLPQSALERLLKTGK